MKKIILYLKKMADTIIQNYPACKKLNAEAYAYTLICHSSVCMCLSDIVIKKKCRGGGRGFLVLLQLQTKMFCCFQFSTHGEIKFEAGFD